MKLKPIPQNTVVHTPTEAEARELLAILHENGYEWYHKNAPIPNPRLKKIAYISIYNSLNGCCKVITYSDKYTYVERYITLAEFKERYCEEEKPQPKFRKGDMVVYNGKPYTVEAVTNMGEYYLYSIDTQECDHLAALPASDLEPYTEPETKPTEDMETKELNLCELLKGHEGEELYSLIAGKCTLKEINEGAGFPICIILDACTTWEYLTKDGKRFNVSDAGCMLFPSRALYEQYPLDPYTAWMKWQEEQKKHTLDVNLRTFDAPDTGVLLKFRTTADRDKCIEEIKAIINKHSNKNKV